MPQGRWYGAPPDESQGRRKSGAAGEGELAILARKPSWSWAVRPILGRRRGLSTFGLVILGPALALATYLVMGPLNFGASTNLLRFVFLVDLVYVIIVAALVLNQLARMIAARRKRSAGSRLHLRLTGVFAFIALAPTITVAVFATLSVNMGLESWFSDRVTGVVDKSMSAANAYLDEHRRNIVTDARALAELLDETRRQAGPLDDGHLRQILSRGQIEIQRGLKEAFVIDGAADLRARGESSYLFDYEPPSPAQIAQADSDGALVIQDWSINELRVLMPLSDIPDRYLYVSRGVDGRILDLLDQARGTATTYRALEGDRGRLLFEFALLYVGFAVILILAAIWLGMWFAETLSRPVGRLTSAAQRVGEGHLDVQVREGAGDDEIAILSRCFNHMARQIKAQTDRLLATNEESERGRRLFDSVLGSVSSGVVGLDAGGRVAFVNRSAERLLDWDPSQRSLALAVAVPEFADLFGRLTGSPEGFVQDEVEVSRGGRLELLLVRMSMRRAAGGEREGYVVTFDDVTDLVAAQRMAAWGEIARRIAHEVKNPLTPIQLAAQRIKRKFASQLPQDDADLLGELTDVVTRQTDDLLRIVNDFDRFARMPEPRKAPENLASILREAVQLQAAAKPDMALETDFDAGEIDVDVDKIMIGQALTNIVKNAMEAIESYQKNQTPENFRPRIRISCEREGEWIAMRVVDNGIGLPQDRSRLFEPYYTTRKSGTGLGLPIVKKIVAEHGGTLDIEDAPAFEGEERGGTMAVIRLPLGEAAAQPPGREA